MAQQNIGLVAGRGYLPFEVLTQIKAKGFSAAVIGLAGEVDPELFSAADRYYLIEPGHLGEMLETLTKFSPREVVFAGKVGKEALFKGGFDATFQKLLQNLPQKNDDAILGAIVAEFEKNGLPVAKQTDYLQHLLPPPGLICGTISEIARQDIEFGFKMAKAIGALDIGQSVVVKQGVVLAIEAIEGTDQAIIRGGQLGGPGAVIVKVSKPQQDERFDVPTIGKNTLVSMAQVGANILAIEAGKTLVTEKEQLLKIAVQNQINIIAINP